MQLIGSFLAETARAEQTALIADDGTETLTYAQLWSRLGSVACLLRDRGVAPGDVVSLCCENTLDYVVNLFGVIAYGAIANPIDPASPQARLQTIVEHSASKLLLSDRPLHVPELGEAVSAASYRGIAARAELLEREGDAAARPALLIYTSGTTGNAKGVLLTQANVLSNVQTARSHLPIAARHRTLCLLPLFHVHGLISDLTTMLVAGGTAVVMPRFELSLAERVERAVREHRVNSFSCVPLVLEFLASVGVDLRTEHLRFAVSGAAPLDPELPPRFAREHGVAVIGAYGMTECTNYSTIMPAGREVPRSVGLPAGCEIRIVDEADRDLPPGQIGELLISGPSVMSGGYYKRPDIEAFLPGSRWLRTGDLGLRDADGFVFIKGRKKNMAIRGGEKVYLDDVDQCLRAQRGVRDAATVRLDRGTHDEVVSFVVPAAGAALAESELAALARQVEATLGQHSRPDRVLLAQSIPRTGSNKVRIAELQRLAEERRG